MNQIIQISNKFHFILHPINQGTQVGNFMFFIMLLNRIQELAQLHSDSVIPDQMLQPLYQLVQYILIVTKISSQLQVILLTVILALHLILILYFLTYFKMQINQDMYQITFQQIIIHYPLILFIPGTYLNLNFLIDNNICDVSDFCVNQNKIVFIIIAIINLLVILTIKLIHLYFARCDTIKNDNIIFKLNSTLWIEIILMSMELAQIIFFILDVSIYIRFTFLCIRTLFSFHQALTRITQTNILLIDSVKFSIACAMTFDLTIYELLFIIQIQILFLLQLRDFIISYYATTPKQHNLITIQILNLSYQIESQVRFRFIVQIIKNKHKCKKCKTSKQLVECMLKSLANKRQMKDSQVVIYCTYISNHIPLKAFIRIMLMNSNDLYYKSASNNLKFELYARSVQQQQQEGGQNQMKNVEHTSTLSVGQVYSTFHSASQLFPIFIQVISSKIDFFNKLINGYQNINQYYVKTFETTQLMLKCKKIMESIFDMTENKLLSTEQTDLISMRMLQIFHSTIYQNSFQAYNLEKNIDEILKNERFKQIESLDNISLVQNRLFIMKTSLVNKRGELINLNKQQLSQFLNEPLEKMSNLNHISQLMPEFLVNIHDNLMENYIQNGYSKLIIQGENSFFKDLKDQLQPCTLNLYNFYDGNDDFIMNMIITKLTQNLDSILFGVDGHILGVTENCSLNFQKESYNDEIKGFIQSYLPHITEQVDELRTQILSSQNYTLNNLKSQWSQQQNLNITHQINLILKQFTTNELQQNGSNNNNFNSYKSQIYSRYTSQSEQNKQNQYDLKKIDSQLALDMIIENSPILLLHPDMIDGLKYLSLQPTQDDGIQIQYSLSFKMYKYKKGQFGYFILNIKDYTKITQGKSIHSNQHNQNNQFSSRIKTSNEMMMTVFTQEEQLHEMNEFQLDQLEKEQQIDNTQQIIQRLDESSVRNYIKSNRDIFDESKVNQNNSSWIPLQNQISSDRMFETNRQFGSSAIFIKPKSAQLSHQEEVDQMEIDLQILEQQEKNMRDSIAIKQQQQQQQQQQSLQKLSKLEDDQEDYNEVIAAQRQYSQSQSKQQQSNILKKFISLKQFRKQNAGMDFASNPSRTSTNSTSKQSLLIVQQIYHNTKLITPLKKISLLLFIICGCVLLSNILNVVLIKSNLNTQTDQISLLRKPQDLNYFYSSVHYQLWTMYLEKQNIIKLSPMLTFRNRQTVTSMYVNARLTMFKLEVQVPIQAAQLGYEYFESSMVVNNTIITNNMSFQQFYQMYYEKYELLFRNNIYLNSSEQDFKELLADGFIRQNLVKIVSTHEQLILAITADTISRQSEVKNYFMGVMLIELFVITAFIGVQLRYWLFIDGIMKQILFLVSRVNEDQALEQINQLKICKEILQDTNSNKWKMYNFGGTIFEQNDNKIKLKMYTDNNLKKKQIVNQAKQYKTSTALYSRIQQTQYFNRNNVIITFIISIIWTAYLMSGYLIHMQYNDDFQPSLTIALKFLQYRHNFDSAVLLGGLIKTEQLITGNNTQFINQSDTVSAFLGFKANLLPIINDVTNVILDKARKNNVKSRFDGLLSSNLCLSMSETLIMCNTSQIELEYYQSDSYLDLINNGILGWTAAFDKFINEEFTYEMKYLTYPKDDESTLNLVQSQTFQNLILQYFVDVQDTLRQFLILFQIDNLSIADGIISVVQYFYLGLGICLFIILSIVSVVWISKAQQNAYSIQQILVLMSLEQILNPNVRQLAKEIHSSLY